MKLVFPVLRITGLVCFESSLYSSRNPSRSRITFIIMGGYCEVDFDTIFDNHSSGFKDAIEVHLFLYYKRSLLTTSRSFLSVGKIGLSLPYIVLACVFRSSFYNGVFGPFRFRVSRTGQFGFCNLYPSARGECDIFQ